MSKRKCDVIGEINERAEKLLKCYDVNTMEDVLNVEEAFFKTTKLNSEFLYTVSSLLSTQTIKIGIEELAKLGNNKNTLGINLGNDYFIPLILDLDHRICEKAHDCDIQLNAIVSLLAKVYEDLKNLFKVDKMKIYVERRNCGVHIYVCNVIVSIFVYECIVEYLNKVSGRLDYSFDNQLPRLPMPGQTKLGKTPYAHQKLKFATDKWFMDKIKLFDYTYETTYKHHEDRIQLCTFEDSCDTIQWNNIIESNVSEERIITNGIITQVKQPPNFLTRTMKRKILTDSRLFLEYHKTKSCTNHTLTLTEIDFKVIPEEQILRALSRLGILIGRQIGATLYDTEGYENIVFISILFISQLNEPSFEIYALCGIVRYLQLSIQNMSCEELFSNFLTIFALMCPTVDSTLRIGKFLCGHIEQICLEVCGDLTAEYILQYITLFNHYKISNTDNITEAISKVFDIEFDENCNSEALEKKLTNLIFPFVFPCIKTHSMSDEYQFYHFNLKTFVKRTFTPGKKQNTPHEMPLHYISEKLSKGNKHIVQTSFTQYISKIPTINVKMGKYKYFINTDCGVFCNVSGTYSRHVPFLHFKDRLQTKRYCLLPQTGTDNLSCLSYVEKYDLQLDVILQNLKLFWFNDVFVPGMFDIHEVNISTITFKKILDELKNRLFLDKPDVYKLKRIYLPIIKKFKISQSIIIESLKNFRLDTVPFPSDDKIYTDYISKSDIGIYQEIYTHCHCVLSSHSKFIIDYDTKIHDQLSDIKFTDKILFDTMQYILQLFLYDEKTIVEFLKQLSLLYQPKNQYRRFLLLFGATGTGKTVLMNLLTDFHGGSFCGILSKLTFNGGSENHCSLALSAATSYLTIIKEACLVDRNILKNLSGNDPIQMRAMHQEFQTIEPISFIICVANEYPKIHDADNAIRDRIGCFNFPCSFVNELRCNNKLESHVHSEAVRSDLNPNLSVGLSNILFLIYNYYSKNNGKVYPKITNERSVHLLKEFMIHNNQIYELLSNAQIVENPDSEISEKEFRKGIERAIIEQPSKMTYNMFKKKFEVLFPTARNIENRIIGFRLDTNRLFNSKLMNFEITNHENDVITEAEISELLKGDDSITVAERNIDLASFRRHFIFNKRESQYKGLKLRNVVVHASGR